MSSLGQHGEVTSSNNKEGDNLSLSINKDNMTFIPARVAITNITQANPGVVTTDAAHYLSTGGVTRLHVPQGYGMVELNQRQVHVTVLSSTMFSIQESLVPPAVNIDTRGFTAFVSPTNPRFTAEVLPIGSGPVPVTSPEPYRTNNVCESLVDDTLFNNSTVEIPF